MFSLYSDALKEFAKLCRVKLRHSWNWDLGLLYTMICLLCIQLVQRVIQTIFLEEKAAAGKTEGAVGKEVDTERHGRRLEPDSFEVRGHRGKTWQKKFSRNRTWTNSMHKDFRDIDL